MLEISKSPSFVRPRTAATAALRSDPAAAGEHLSEGLHFIDREPLRGFFTIDVVKAKRKIALQGYGDDDLSLAETEP